MKELKEAGHGKPQRLEAVMSKSHLVGVWGVAEGGHRKLQTQVGVFDVQNSGAGPELIGQDQSLN